MMRKLTNADHEKLSSYIKNDPEMNLFFIGDLENFGIEGETVSFYVKEENNNWDFVILRYLNSYILYTPKESYDVKEVYDFLKDKKIDCISGKYDLICQLESFFPDKENQKTYLSRCNAIKEDRNLLQTKDYEIKTLSIDVFEDIYALYLTIDEFKKTYQGEGKKETALESMKLNLEHGGFVLGIYKENQLVSIAEASAANSLGAMLVGVATHPNYRGLGLASLVVKELCLELFKQNKQFLCLFYDNPKAGSIYQKIGFEEIGFYSLLR